MSKTSPILATENITKQFTGLTAVKDLSIEVGEGEITSIIGPNGAGKTTLFNLLTGFLKPNHGEIHFRGQRITGLPPYRITRLGIARTFQLIRIFPKLSVLDNIMLGCLGLKGDNLFYAVLKTKEIVNQFYRTKEDALIILETVGLPEFAHEYANHLSYGQQKLVEIGRVLASDPQIILLDEPMAGLSITMIDRMIDLIFRLKKQGKTIVFIEHNLGVVMGISERIFVLNFGQKIASGSPADIRSNEEVIDAYLGI
jgi:ABC-type branched-subunit amino acid transport system ATPase component